MLIVPVRVAPLPGEAANPGDIGLVPGMLVEAFIRTEEHAVLRYLDKRLTEQVMRTFREK
ncbi:hypothetical protein NVS89_21325 [Ancylobacter sp. MQZ15Z-1]|uniref:HlyD family type I secretion periplasmic adaptor subunit n=1 Tax=Ancylobacter mangrovi TaxID=2972472 RepID=A0A9X2PF97_9HYPH|nr:hypothetical protein [Ancylobacter mangrovi]MCS0497637.1 hypothetical protein [Ancylobacter mangrovi]